MESRPAQDSAKAKGIDMLNGPMTFISKAHSEWAGAVRTNEDALNRFEMIRRILGHGNTLHQEVVSEVVDARYAKEIYRAYEDALDKQREEQREEFDDVPDGVLPVVDMLNGRVTHTTCTGNTEVTLNLAQRGGGYAGVRVQRNVEDTIESTCGRDIAIILLADRVRINVPGRSPLFVDRAIKERPELLVSAYAHLIIAGCSDEQFIALCARQSMMSGVKVDVKQLWEDIVIQSRMSWPVIRDATALRRAVEFGIRKD